MSMQVGRRALGVNAGLNILRTVLTMLFPVVTFWRIANVFSVDTVGLYGFANTAAGYFIMFAALGIGTYALREGVSRRKNFEDMSRFASEMFTINVISSAVTYLALLAFVFLVPRFAECRELLLILSVNIVLMTLGCDWIHSVYEDFLFITLRTIAVYVVSLILFFIFVWTPEDLYVYAWITVLATSGAQLLNIPARRKYCRVGLVKPSSVRQHVKPVMILFANTITTSLYVNADVLILGFLRTDSEVGLYSVAVKIYMLFKALLGAVITVATPRLAAIWQENREKFANDAARILRMLVTLLAPVATGLFFLGDSLIQIISNAEYLEAVGAVQWLCGALLMSIIGWFVTACVLIPAKQEKAVLKITIIAAVVNIALNFILIPIYGFVAAAVTTVIAEGLACVLGCIKARKMMSVRKAFHPKFCIAILAGCAAVAGMCLLVRRLDAGAIITAGVSFCAAIPLYAGVTATLGNTEMAEILDRYLDKLGGKEETVAEDSAAGGEKTE